VKPRPTIIDVAERAGVSKSTVSRVIADDGQGVSEAKKRRVRKAIAELGYVPNAVASSMRTARTNTIMLAIPDITNPFWPEVARGVQDVMDEAGYSVVFANSDWHVQRERKYLGMVRRNRLDGLLINPVGVSNDELKALAVPTVILGLQQGIPDFDTVGSDSYAASKTALDHLVSLGHRRIGLISGQRQGRARSPRLSAYVDFLRDAGLEKEDNLMVCMPFSLVGGMEGMAQLLALPQRPTAVYCDNDIIAIGALKAAHDDGLRVPEDISITGVDDIFAASTTTPPLTTVAKPKYDLGRQASRFLCEQIEQGVNDSPRTLLLSCRLQIRGSTAPPV
jgi:LacI family transcriptional regulator